MEHGGGPAWALAIEHSTLAQFIRESVWLYPTLNVFHVLAAALLLGSIVVLDLRVLGAGLALSAAPLARLVLPVSIAALAISAPTGVLLFAAEASALVRNPVFLAKMGLITASLVNIAVFHAGAFRSIERWGRAFTAPPAARIAAGLSLALWLAVVAGGRLIAYF
jgi:hypothetical protein